MVELQINEPTAVPEWLFVIFAVCTTVLVSVHIFALMISTYLLPNIEAISKLQSSKLITESPHERMRGFIELAWVFSTVQGNNNNIYIYITFWKQKIKNQSLIQTLNFRFLDCFFSWLRSLYCVGWNFGTTRSQRQQQALSSSYPFW